METANITHPTICSQCGGSVHFEQSRNASACQWCGVFLQIGDAAAPLKTIAADQRVRNGCHISQDAQRNRESAAILSVYEQAMQLRWRHDSENLNVVLHVLGGLRVLNFLAGFVIEPGIQQLPGGACVVFAMIPEGLLHSQASTATRPESDKPGGSSATDGTLSSRTMPEQGRRSLPAEPRGRKALPFPGHDRLEQDAGSRES